LKTRGLVRKLPTNNNGWEEFTQDGGKPPEFTTHLTEKKE